MSRFSRKKPRLEPLEPRTFLSGTPSFVISVNDPDNLYPQYDELIRTTVEAAASDWAAHLDSDASIQIEVQFDESLAAPTIATGGDGRVVFFHDSNGIRINETPIAQELATGIDPNGWLP